MHKSRTVPLCPDGFMVRVPLRNRYPKSMEPSLFNAPVGLRHIRASEDVVRCFAHLAELHLAVPDARHDELTPELRMLVRFCNQQRETLFRYAKDPANAGCRIAGWIIELATAPTMDWSNLRHNLQPLIRRFAMPPRPRGTALFSDG